MNLLRKLFSRRWVSGTLLVLLAMGLFARLGVWQLARLEERRAENRALRAVLDSPPLDLAEPLPAEMAALENRFAVAVGQYDFANERIVLLQTWQGQVGVQLVTPLLIEGMPDTAVLVNRGWVPQSDYEAGLLQKYQNDTGRVQVEGYLAPSQPGRDDPGSAAPKEVYRVDVAAVQAAVPYDLLPLFLVEAPTATVELDPPLRAERAVDLSEGPHLSYAVQWFIFCLLTGGLYLVFVQRSERERPFTPTTQNHET